MARFKEAYLVVTEWAMSMGGEHFSGRLYGDGMDDNINIEQEMTTGLAGRLNKKDGGRSHRPGEFTSRFETKESLYAEAEKKALELNPDLEILFANTMASVTYTIWAKDKERMERMNELWEANEMAYAETNDPWSYGDGQLGKVVDDIQNKWFALIHE